jgi:hypothetical protein
MTLAQAFADNDEILAMFVEALRENAEHIMVPQVLATPAKTKLRFVKKERAANTPAKQAVQQAPQPRKKREKGKRSRIMLGMYRNEQQLTR